MSTINIIFVRYYEEVSVMKYAKKRRIQLVAVPIYCNFRSADIVQKVQVQFGGHRQKSNGLAEYYCKYYMENGMDFVPASGKPWQKRDMEEINRDFLSNASASHLLLHPEDLYKEEDKKSPEPQKEKTPPKRNVRTRSGTSEAVVIDASIDMEKVQKLKSK